MPTSLNKSKMIFTRYLYLKDEVLLSIVISLLRKKGSALYWVFELYHSGFEEEVLQYLWKIYFDFYYVLNPGFQDYFIKKHNEWVNSTLPEEKKIIIWLIVSNLMIRPHNFDVFMLRQHINKKKEADPDPDPEDHGSFIKTLEKQNYLEIADFILNQKYETIKMLKDAILYFSKKGIEMDEKKIIKKWTKNLKTIEIDESIQLLAFIMNHFCKILKINMGKKIFMSVDKNDIELYETIYTNKATNLRAYTILPMAYIHKIDEDNCLGLFHLERNKFIAEDPDSIKKMYWYNWEYYASFSPIWFHRIEKYKGKYDHLEKKIEFPDDEEIDWNDEFYSQYGYEPDEQLRETQDFSIQTIECHKTWIDFFKENEERSIYKPEESFLKEMKCIIY